MHFVERDWTLSLCKVLVEQCSYLNVHVQSARVDDSTIGYGLRAHKAKAWGADLAILHHANGMFWPKEHELEGRARPGFHGGLAFVADRDIIAVHVATTMLRALPDELRRRRTTPYRCPSGGRWTKRASYHLRHYRDNRIPAVLMEWGFATNPGDLAMLERHIGLVRAVDEGVAALIKVKEQQCKS